MLSGAECQGGIRSVVVGQVGWGTDGMGSVWSGVVWHGSHGVVGRGRFVHGSVRYSSV